MERTGKLCENREDSHIMDSVTKETIHKIDMTNVPDNLVFGLDIGTRSIVGTVGYKNSTNGFVVVAQVAIEHDTRAMIDGQIHDIGQVALTIEKIHSRLEELTGRKFHDVCIAAAGRVLKTVEASADMHFSSDTVVTRDHIYALNMLAVENAYETLRQDRQSDNVQFYCVGYSVKQYYQNDYPMSNLEGHKSSDIRTELIATFLPDEVVDGLYAAVERAGLFVANLTLEPIAAINVAIPEKYRLLNIALVDVGAGTSDISITRDGAIVAYGMIPMAGDEVTESIAKHYLTDFTEADRLKCATTGNEEVEYHDIMGLPQKISSQEVLSVVEETVRSITKTVSDKITELNGGKTVSAVFVVGGGGKIGGFVETLAEYQGIAPERVALRGKEVLGNVQFLQSDIQVDSLLVTPIGICLNYYEQKNNFIFVNVNGERIKLYDNNKLTIMDAAMQMGFPNEELFPQRGKAITYYVDGEKRMQRGQPGEAAVIHINGKETGINTPIDSNDKIEIIPSTRGTDASLMIGKLPEFKSTISFQFNGRKVTSDRVMMVNDEMVSELYEIQDGDRIEVRDYYTLEQVLEMMDIAKYDNVTVNNLPADMDTKVYDNFTILCDVEEQIPIEYIGTDSMSQELSQKETEPEENLQELRENAEPEESQNSQLTEEIPVTDRGRRREDAFRRQILDSVSEMDVTVETGTQQKAEKQETEPAAEEMDGQPVEEQIEEKKEPEVYSGGPRDISITVNGEPVILKNKANYILVDVLDFYPVDTSVAHGDHLEMSVNGVACDFTCPVEPGAHVRIEWVG